MNETEHDRRLNAAWNAASREEPPLSLDAAIRAAARRAVDAAPRKRDKHWWYPLAAAATVAVLAVGIIQLTPPEQIAPTIVADMAFAPREANKDVVRQVAPADKKIVEPSAAITAASPPATPSPAAQAPARRAQTAASGRLAGERTQTPATEGDTQKDSLAAKRELVAQEKLASAKSDAAAVNTAPSPSAAAPAMSAPPRSEPFPAAAPEPRRDAYADERNAAANTPAKSPAAQVARSAAAPSTEEAQTKGRVATAKVATADEAKAKEASARSVEEWIKRIRDLKNAGRLDEAAKELAAFRNEYGERADALLPADMRATSAQPSK
ncbi:MAG TPA: hypothetical protein VGK75_20505 [Casimicrobiaceae bacterium]|jgi:hypothetical protein